MRIKHLLFSLLTFCSVISFAETQLGVRYGAGISLVYFTPSINQRPEISPVNFAITYRYHNESSQDYERFMNFGAELGYNQRAYRLEGDVPILRKSHLLEFPFMMQARVPIIKRFQIVVTGLCYGAVSLKNTEQYTMNGITETYKFEDNNLRRFEYGIGGGLGFALAYSKIDFTLDARYTAGLSYLFRPTIDLYESMPMQITIGFSVAYKLGQ
ncbi:MAG: outer membrane beta-barrel protein [Bacteroidales bacterium]